MGKVHPRTSSTNRWPLFEEIFYKNASEDYSECSILDYGGGSGNLLYFSNGKIKEEYYTCIDVSSEAIEQGKKEFPLSKFVHYNRYNYMYNHNGNSNECYPTNISIKQDYIWAYSVFSHTDLREFILALKWLMKFEYKMIAVSFLTFNEMVDWAYNKRIEEYGACAQIKKIIDDSNIDILYLIDNDIIEINEYKLDRYGKFKHFLTFYDIDFLLSQLTENNIVAKIKYPGDGYVPFVVIEREEQ